MYATCGGMGPDARRDLAVQDGFTGKLALAHAILGSSRRIPEHAPLPGKQGRLCLTGYR